MRFLQYFILFFGFIALAQENPVATPFIAVDSLYREDQFYFGITYNLLQDTPAAFVQSGLSTAFNVGFLRDMPINEKRTFAVALGLGFSYNKYHENLVVSETPSGYDYSIVEDGSFTRNKLEQVFLDLPLEIRWRNSTPESHKFWRIYTGFKVRYLVFDKTKYVANNTDIVVIDNSDFNKVQYGPYIAFGFNTWNFHAYYGLNPIFKSAKIGDQSIDMKTINLGLMFYIL